MGVHNSSVKQKKIRFSTKILRDYIWHHTTMQIWRLGVGEGFVSG